MVIAKQKGGGIKLENVAWPADDLARSEKAGYEVLQLLTFSRYDDPISAADGLIGRAVQRNNEGVFKGTRRVRIVKEVEAKGR